MVAYECISSYSMTIPCGRKAYQTDNLKTQHAFSCVFYFWHSYFCIKDMFINIKYFLKTKGLMPVCIKDLPYIGVLITERSLWTG